MKDLDQAVVEFVNTNFSVDLINQVELMHFDNKASPSTIAKRLAQNESDVLLILLAAEGVCEYSK